MFKEPRDSHLWGPWSLSVLPCPCHVFDPEAPFPLPSPTATLFSASKVQPPTRHFENAVSADATRQGPFCLLLHSEPSQPLSFPVSVSPWMAGPIPYTEKLPSRNWLSLIEIMLMSSFNNLQKVLHFTDWGQEKRRGNSISTEYWFMKVTSFQAKVSRILRQFIYSVKQLLDPKPIIGRNISI